ncbi:MAG: hypothetical protein ACR2P0_20395, partial [Acidimicrobiales bacterium]
MSKGSFSQGVGQWIGAAEVYDANGEFLGTGRDTRTVEADDGDGTVTVNVTFEGPFSLGGSYTIADRTTHRLYQGPLNYGFADVLGHGLISAHNYWSDLGMNQRFFLMVLPDGSRQLSLALISRGEVLQYVVVGEYLRQTDPSKPEPPTAVPMNPVELEGDLTAGRGEVLLHRPGQWSGDLTLLDADLTPTGSITYRETIEPHGGELAVSLSGLSFARDASYTLITAGAEAWTPVGDVLGSYS